ncbi:prolyl oligopeptidase family serine peptidase [Gemmatimonadota bacterium]
MRILTMAVVLTMVAATATAQDNRFTAEDVFQLERAVDPQISPDGNQIVYVRTGLDIMTDRSRSSLWIVNTDGSDHRPLVTGPNSYSSPRWSPDGSLLAYVSGEDDRTQIFLRWMDTGQETKLTNLTESPDGLSWSPDGQWIAFSMFVAHDEGTLTAEMPHRPEGAEWGPPIKVIDQLNYRADGAGYLDEGYDQLFVIPVEGGTPRQVSSGHYDHGGSPAWSADGSFLIISVNRSDNVREEPNNSDIYVLSLTDGSYAQLTDRFGPDGSVRLSPDGGSIAYTGYDDTFQGYTVQRLYVMNSDGSNKRLISGDLDRDVGNPQWSADGRGLFFQYDDEGNTKVGHISLNGNVEDLAENVGGLSLGRPYGGGQYSVAANGTFAFTLGTPYHPAELAVASRGSAVRKLTHINEDLFGHKELGQVEEIWWESSYDNRRIQGWITKPPGFDPANNYPLVLEIHGGPFSNYGDRFSAENQLYASAGYVVLSANPRGSTSYGQEFGNLIHHNYPSQDHDDLMSGVDAVIELGYVDEDNLFITGGSGGGVLSSWAVGHTDRFAAAAVQKPVINWYSFVLNADGLSFFWRYWFPGKPWDYAEHYMARSPIHYAGNVTTPTMLITGEEDYRTPMSETEQFYGALKIQGVETTMVRIPDASHGIADRPSNMVAKIAYILGWFDKYRTGQRDVS